MQEFILEVEINRKRYRFNVHQLLLNDRIEQYRLTGASKQVTVQSNRPLLEKKRLKHRKPQWKVVEGNVSNISALEKTLQALEARIYAFYKPLQ